MPTNERSERVDWEERKKRKMTRGSTTLEVVLDRCILYGIKHQKWCRAARLLYSAGLFSRHCCIETPLLFAVKEPAGVSPFDELKFLAVKTGLLLLLLLGRGPGVLIVGRGTRQPTVTEEQGSQRLHAERKQHTV